MKKLVPPMVLCAAMLAGTTAHAQSFTYETDWQPVESIGGYTTPDGPEYQGGLVEGTYKTTYEDGSVDAGTVKCVGMDQPEGGVFEIHMTCNFGGESGTGTIVYGCTFQGPRGPGVPLSCIGAFEATSGEQKGRRGNITMDWYTAEKASGTGQWFRSGG